MKSVSIIFFLCFEWDYKIAPLDSLDNTIDSLSVNKTVTYTADDITDKPNEFLLSQNYPKPFNSSTVIRYSLPQETKINLLIYDITGKEVCIPLDETQKPAKYEIIYNGSKLSSGVYYYVLRSEKFVQARKFVLLR